MIKVINVRENGSLYHYAHFMCDCLFPEIVNNIYKNKKIYRLKNLHQTIGNFNNIYNNVMKSENIELSEEKFKSLNVNTKVINVRKRIKDIKDFNKIRKYIFKRYNIINTKKNSKIVLIKRDSRINLINDKDLSLLNKNITTGKERREINDIEILENILKNKYKNNFKSVFLENMSFQEQVKLFNQAHVIIAAHGAALSNMVFCKKNTLVIEVHCNKIWKYFDVISKKLELRHIKSENNIESIIKILNDNIHKKPVAKKPVAKKPIFKKPVAKKHVFKKPVVKKHSMKKSVIKKRIMKKYIMKKSIMKKHRYK